VRKIGEQIRVTVQLVSVPEGKTLWSEKFDEKFTETLKIEDLITGRVASALTMKLTGEEIKRSPKRYAANTEAHQLYLKGRFSSINWSAEAWKESLNHFEQAIKIDRDYAPAYAGLATTYAQLGSRGLLPPEEGWLKKAESAALKALEIDDTLPEAHTS